MQTVQDTVVSMFISPFTEMELVSLSSGVYATEKVGLDLIDAYEKGQTEMQSFIEDRLVNQETGFFDPLKKLKLGTFTKMLKKTVKVKTNGKEVQFSAQSDIFGKIALMQQSRSLDLKKVFCYPLGPVPWSLASSTGELMKTSKSSLMHELEKGLTHVDKVEKPFGCIIDGMALVRKVKNTGFTYDEFADELLKCAVVSCTGATRVDIVFDVYLEDSIKNAERGKREVGKLQFKTILGSQQIKQWGAFLSSGNNKTELIRFLVRRWKNNCSIIGNIKLYVAFDDQCIHIQENGSSQLIEELQCNHEEADTRMLLHAKHMSPSVRNVLIHTPDTDVLVIAIDASTQIDSDLFVRTGIKSNARIISINKVKQSLKIMYDLEDINSASKALTSLHAFTGCDTISAFSGKGKVKPLKIMLRKKLYIDVFSEFGNQPEMTDDEFSVLKKFVCDLYGHVNESTDKVRYLMYSSRQGKMEAKSIPPCSDSLQLHASRACYQSFIWRQCLIGKPIVPSPVGHGWEINEDEALSICWNTVKPAPEEILELMFCTCKKECVGGSCPCVDNMLSCTDACTKQECNNFADNEDESEEFSEEDYTDDESEEYE